MPLDPPLLHLQVLEAVVFSPAWSPCSGDASAPFSVNSSSMTFVSHSIDEELKHALALHLAVYWMFYMLWTVSLMAKVSDSFPLCWAFCVTVIAFTGLADISPVCIAVFGFAIQVEILLWSLHLAAFIHLLEHPIEENVPMLKWVIEKNDVRRGEGVLWIPLYTFFILYFLLVFINCIFVFFDFLRISKARRRLEEVRNVKGELLQEAERQQAAQQVELRRQPGAADRPVEVAPEREECQIYVGEYHDDNDEGLQNDDALYEDDSFFAPTETRSTQASSASGSMRSGFSTLSLD